MPSSRISSEGPAAGRIDVVVPDDRPRRRRSAGAPPAPRSRSLPPRPENLGSHPEKRTRSKAEERAVERLRPIVLALPGVTEKIAWGELTWRAGKMFAQMETHHHGAGRVAVWLALPPGLQEALVEEDPGRFFRPPYVGQKGWVGVRIDGRPDWTVVASVVRDAHRFVTSGESERGIGRRGARSQAATVGGALTDAAAIA